MLNEYFAPIQKMQKSSPSFITVLRGKESNTMLKCRYHPEPFA